MSWRPGPGRRAETMATTRDDRWYRVRILPYRSQLDVIDGVVVTFIDIPESLQLASGCDHVTH